MDGWTSTDGSSTCQLINENQTETDNAHATTMILDKATGLWAEQDDDQDIKFLAPEAFREVTEGGPGRKSRALILLYGLRSPSVFSGTPLKRNSGNHHPDVKAADALKDKVVALYFSAHWCPHSRQFSPTLKDFYKEVSENNPLEVVFVSCDRSAEDMKKHLEEAHGDWLYIPYGDPNSEALFEKYGVKGIPSLIIIKQDGSIANPDARANVQKGPGEFASWKSICGI